MSQQQNSNSGSKTSYCLGSKNDVEQVFNRFDKNNDGMISISELHEVLRALGSDPAPDELKRIMSEIDTDGDGFIDFKEFADFHRGGSDADAAGDQNKTANELKDAFDLYDRDRNGLISANELHVVLNKLGEKCSVKDCSGMIKSVDVNGDGSVDFEEFKKMMKPTVN